MNEIALDAKPSAAKLIAAFAAVYVIWGSTYLAIRIAIESTPPFLMAGVRFLVAGAALYAWSRMRGAEPPTLRHWRSATIVGGLLLVGGNGAVVWSEQRVASGAVSLLVATVPLWVVVIGWLVGSTTRPGPRLVGGIVLGLAGIAMLIGPDALGGGKVDTVGALAVLFGSLCWATGSLYGRTAELPKAPLLATAMEMLAGGAILTVVAVASGEAAAFRPSAITFASGLAVAYLVVFGSLVGFTAYVWLLRAATPARVSTYAYVNPVVAVLLGWAFAGEPLTTRTVVAAAVVLAAVALITGRQPQPASKKDRELRDPSIPGPLGGRPAGSRA